MGRGIGAKVTTATDKALQESACTFCGSCLDACPVNALLEADRWRKGREWEYEKVNSVCLLCGNGCDITVSTKDGAIQKINAGKEHGSSEHYICAYGRFGFDCLEAEARLRAPLKKVNGQLKETTWDDALKTVSGKLKKAGKDAGFISTAGIQNEDALALKKLASTVVKTKHYDSTLSLYAAPESLTEGQKADMDSSDLIVLVGLNPSQWDRRLPALDASIRKRVSRGAKLIVINSSETRLSDIASVKLTGDEIASLKGLIKALGQKGLKADKKLTASVKGAKVTEDTDTAAELIAQASEPLIVTSPGLFDAAANVTLFKGKVVTAGLESNARGVALMGLTTKGKTYGQMAEKGMKVLYAVGEVPLKKRPKAEFLVVQASHLTELAKQADVVLPAATYLESAGTMVDYLGRLKYLPKVVEAQGQSKSHRDIFIQVAKKMGSTIKRPTEAEVKKAFKVKAKQPLRPFVKKEGLEISPDEFIESINASVINGSRILWLKEAEVFV
jgi:predicted molibdopterin-dependent oxidoreductase YjgC